jgi:hypothetical protein
MFESKQTPGYEVLERELKELEILGSSFLSLKAFLEKHNLFMTKQDIRTLRTLLKDNKNWKLVKVTEYQLQRRGKRK